MKTDGQSGDVPNMFNSNSNDTCYLFSAFDDPFDVPDDGGFLDVNYQHTLLVSSDADKPVPVSNGTLLAEPAGEVSHKLKQLEDEVKRLRLYLAMKLPSMSPECPALKEMEKEGFQPYLMKTQEFIEERLRYPDKPILFIKGLDKVSAQIKLELPPEATEAGRSFCKNCRSFSQKGLNSYISWAPRAFRYMFEGEEKYRLQSLIPYDRVFAKVESGILILDVDFNPSKAVAIVLGHNKFFKEIYNEVSLTRSSEPKKNNYHTKLLPFIDELEDYKQALVVVTEYFYLNMISEFINLVKAADLKVSMHQLDVHFDLVEFFNDFECPSAESSYFKAEQWTLNEAAFYDDERVRRRNLLYSITAYSGDQSSRYEEIYCAVCSIPKAKYKDDYGNILRVERRRFIGRKNYGLASALTFPDLDTIAIDSFNPKLIGTNLLNLALQDCCSAASINNLRAFRSCKVKKKFESVFEKVRAKFMLDELLVIQTKKNRKGETVINLRLKPSFRAFQYKWELEDHR